jgi:hypothetical protein
MQQQQQQQQQAQQQDQQPQHQQQQQQHTTQQLAEIQQDSGPLTPALLEFLKHLSQIEVTQRNEREAALLMELTRLASWQQHIDFTTHPSTSPPQTICWLCGR